MTPYEKWYLDKFDAHIITDSKVKRQCGQICLQTPHGKYTMPKEVYKCLMEKLNIL